MCTMKKQGKKESVQKVVKDLITENPEVLEGDEDSGVSKRILHLTTDMTTALASKLILSMMQMVSKDKNTPIVLLINSVGGDVAAAYSLISMMEYLKWEHGFSGGFITINLSMAYSAAGMVFIAGDHRIMFNTSTFMSHEMSVGFSEQLKVSEADAARKIEKFWNKKAIDLYSKYSKLSRKKVKEMLYNHKDIWLIPSECKQFGLVDEIINVF